jgi:hypothetical protein
MCGLKAQPSYIYVAALCASPRLPHLVVTVGPTGTFILCYFMLIDRRDTGKDEGEQEVPETD